MTTWNGVNEIVVMYSGTFGDKGAYAARIRTEGLTAYGETFEGAVDKLMHMRKVAIAAKAGADRIREKQAAGEYETSVCAQHGKLSGDLDKDAGCKLLAKSYGRTMNKMVKDVRGRCDLLCRDYCIHEDECDQKDDTIEDYVKSEESPEQPSATYWNTPTGRNPYDDGRIEWIPGATRNYGKPRKAF